MTLVDTNVLIDIISKDRNWFAWSAATLEARSDLGSLLINDTVYSELSARFDSETLLDETVRTMDLKFERCFQVMEADSEDSFREWTANWDDLVDFEIVPVRTSADAAAAIAPEL